MIYKWIVGNIFKWARAVKWFQELLFFVCTQSNGFKFSKDETVVFNTLVGPLQVLPLPSLRWPGNNCNENILHIPQSSGINTSSSDVLVSYPGHLLELGCYLSAEMQSVYSTTLANWAYLNRMSCHTEELWYNKTVCLCMMIYMFSFRGLNTLAKELTATICIMQNSFNELSTPIVQNVNKWKLIKRENLYLWTSIIELTSLISSLTILMRVH